MLHFQNYFPRGSISKTDHSAVQCATTIKNILEAFLGQNAKISKFPQIYFFFHEITHFSNKHSAPVEYPRTS